MIKEINEHHSIFSSFNYEKDIVAFNLIEAIKSSAKLMVSDEISFVVCSMLFPTVPTWIWTSDCICEKSINELTNWLVNYFQNESESCFVAKPPIVNQIINAFEENRSISKNVIHMESFECRKLLAPKNKHVIIEPPNQNDLTTLSRLCCNFEKECFETDMSEKDSINEAQNFMNNNKAYIIRVDGKAVAMAKSTRETDTHIAVNGVYTLPEHRCRGYAAALVAYISKLILDEGKIPVLYTDLANPCSNKAYINVGFLPCGKVDEVHLKWK